MESTAATEPIQPPAVDTELSQLHISEQMRANSSFMKIMATLFHYGNQAMNAAQLVVAVRALNLLPLRGETPKSTIQGIISTSRKVARDLKLADPFRIDKDGTGRQAKYAIADEIMGGIEAPMNLGIPDEPIVLRPVDYATANPNYYANQGAKRQRKPPSIFSPVGKVKPKKRTKAQKAKKRALIAAHSDIDVDTDDDYDFASAGSEDDSNQNEIAEEDTIAHYSLVYAPPTSDIDYIEPINFTEYPIAGHFAIVQQKGYSYPRFRSHEKIKIPKVNCEDKFRVTDILTKEKKVVGRLFVLADGHGGPGCSEYFVRKTPEAVESLCAQYDASKLGDAAVQKQFEADIKSMIQTLDDNYLTMKREQIAAKKSPDDHVDNDGCTLVLNIFFGEWLININVGDSRTVLISAPEPSAAPPTSIENANTIGIDNDYKMDVVFASQDHKPYLEHLARHILENGGEFVDSVQNRVIKVDLDKLKEDGNRHTKRVALKNARIRPKDYQAGLDQSAPLAAQAAVAETNPETVGTDEKTVEAKEVQELTEVTKTTSISTAATTATTTTPATTTPAATTPATTTPATTTPATTTPATTEGGTVWATQSAVRTTVNNDISEVAETIQQAPAPKSRMREDRIPSLNVARSCGDLDFKMDPLHKIISCEPDVTFIRISDQPYVDHTILLNGPHKEKRRHFLFMSTDGTFDYMYEETAERQNRAIAKVIGPMIEDGEKIGKFLLEEEERIKGQTIEHGKQEQSEKTDDAKMEEVTQGANVDEKMEEGAQVANEGDKKEEGAQDANEGDKMEEDVPEKIADKMDEDTQEEMTGEKKAEETSEKQEEKMEEAVNKDEADKPETISEMDVDVPNGEDKQEKEANKENQEDQGADKETKEDQDGKTAAEEENKEESPRIPLLHRELTEEETKNRKVKEATLVGSARYFANREGAHGFFASTLQDYDDCTIILVEI